MYSLAKENKFHAASVKEGVARGEASGKIKLDDEDPSVTERKLCSRGKVCY